MFDKDYFDKLIQRLDRKLLDKQYQECLDIIQEQITSSAVSNNYLQELNEYKLKVLKLMK